MGTVERASLREGVAYMWRCGRHSGFPICCIVWFMLRWHIVFRADVTERLHRRWFYWREGRNAWADWRDEPGYVRCPLCIIRQRTVPVLMCPPGCKRPRAGGVKSDGDS